MGFLNLVREIFQIYDPTWGDIQNLLHVLLTGAEQATVFSKAREEADKEKRTTQVMLISDGGIKQSQKMNPTGT